MILKVHRTTVARKLQFLGFQARARQTKFLALYSQSPIEKVQFDELETFEHTKMKPLSVAIAIEEKTRKILDFQVSSMPAKGLLAKKSREKYGRRENDRSKGMKTLFENLQPIVQPYAEFLSDKEPRYPKWLRDSSEYWTHKTTKGRRGCVTGQGELKRGGYDPLFALNHTCAMLRANINRLFRRTWNTTKKPERLRDHLSIYMDFHNRVLT